MDRRQIVRQWKEGAAKALVTLVRAEGSTYRRPGAHLLIGVDSEYAGTISGGCLESEVVRRAAWKVRDGAVVERYSTIFDDTAEIPYGLGCGGVVDLILEPANTSECQALLRAMEASLNGAELLVITRLPRNGVPLARIVVGSASGMVFASDGFDFAEIGLTSVTYSDLALPFLDDRFAVERLSAPQRLFVLGAGNDAKPVVTMAALLGWSVIVADGRSQLARSDRFPEAERVLSQRSFEVLELKANDAVVLMTHSYEQDLRLLKRLLQMQNGGFGSAMAPGYIGMLGARHRSSLLISEAAAALGYTVAECCERIYAPVGLDLGGDGPEAIALAVTAEIQAWTQGKLGHSRRLTAGEVAEQIADVGASRLLQTKCAMDMDEIPRP